MTTFFYQSTHCHRLSDSGEECLPAAACRVEARSLMTSVVETASKFLGFLWKWFFRVIKGLFHGYVVGYHWVIIDRAYDFWEIISGFV